MNRTSRRGRGQTATELLVVLAIGLAVLGFFLYSGQQRLGSTQAALAATQAQSVADEITSAADAVWLEGTGAKRTITVTLPDQTVSATVSGNTVKISIAVPGGVTDAVSKAKETLYGSIAVTQKRQALSIQATETGVRIGTQALDASPKIVAAELLASNLSQTAEGSFNITNLGTVAFNVTLVLSWAPTTVVAALADPADLYFTLPSGTTRNVRVNFSFSPGALGAFSGFVALNASNGDADLVDLLANAYPIACPPAPTAGGTGCGIATVEVKTYSDSSYTIEKEAFTPAETVNTTSDGWSAGETITATLSGPGGTVGGYPKDLAANSTGSVTDSWLPAGAASGTYTETFNGSAASASVNFTVSSCG